MKKWNMFGIVVGLAAIIMGIIICFTPAESYSTSKASTAVFGGDFYTYEYEATQIAANNVAQAAGNIRELGKKLALYSGLLLIFGGLSVVAVFGRKLSLDSQIENQKPEEQVVVIAKMSDEVIEKLNKTFYKPEVDNSKEAIDEDEDLIQESDNEK